MWNFQTFNNETAVISEEHHAVTYAQLNSLCQELSNQIDYRCLVFNLCSNTLGALVGYLAFINARIVPLMLNQELDKFFLQNLIYLYKPDYLYLPIQLIGDFDHYRVVYSRNHYVLLKTEFKSEYPLHVDLALLLTTSGSTGSPNLVRQSYQNILSNTISIVSFLDINNSERTITTLPMSYTYGLSIINTHIYVGASIVLTDKSIMQKEFWHELKFFSVTSFGGVPYTFEMLDKLKIYRMELPSLKTLTQAGGKLSIPLHSKFAEYADNTQRNFVVMYGQTEATARMSYLPSNLSLEKCGSIGIAIPGGEFVLVDDNGLVIQAPYTEGELVYMGDNVCLGYANTPDDLAVGDEWHGRLLTGDIAKFDEEGYYHITGRKKRFLKIFGNRVNLDEIEISIKNYFENIDCACVGEDNCMYICITATTIKHDVLSFVAQKTALNHSAFKLITLESIPKNESGKILYKELEKHCAGIV